MGTNEVIKEFHMFFNAAQMEKTEDLPFLLINSITHSFLPRDVGLIVFEKLKAELSSLALVCKKWKALADDKALCGKIRPFQAFGTKEWKKYIHVDAGIEPSLPRRVYGDLEEGDHILTFIPNKVKVTKENGMVEEVPLDSLEAIGKLIEKLDFFNEEELYTGRSRTKAIIQKRVPEKPHWVWIDKNIIGRDQSYEEQLKLARIANEIIPGTQISSFMDTSISILMECARSGVRNFLINLNEKPSTCVRVKESVFSKTLGKVQLTVGFYPSHLDISYYMDSESVGCVLARKSF